MIKTFISFIIFLLSIVCGYSNSPHFETGDTLYVWSVDGLLMREAPAFDSKAIKKLPYGEQIIIIEKIDREYEFMIADSVVRNKTTLPRVVLTGKFVKIQYSGLHGYVFDSFLSKLEPMKEDETVSEYFHRTLKLAHVIDRSRRNEEYEFERYVYKNGVIVQRERGRENWWSRLYFIPDISITEGYLLVNKTTGFEKTYKHNLDEGSLSIETLPRKFEPGEIILQTSLFSETTIQIKSHYVVITEEGGN